jgi:hypothetical protein
MTIKNELVDKLAMTHSLKLKKLKKNCDLLLKKNGLVNNKITTSNYK